VRVVLAFVFFYHGLVPKLIAHHHDEIVMLTSGGISTKWADPVLFSIGVAEMAWAFLLLLGWHARWMLALTAVVMPVTLLGVAMRSPQFLVTAFNPVTLNLLVAALAWLGWYVSVELPSASRSLRRRTGSGA